MLPSPGLAEGIHLSQVKVKIRAFRGLRGGTAALSCEGTGSCYPAWESIRLRGKADAKYSQLWPWELFPGDIFQPGSSRVVHRQSQGRRG